MAKSDRSMWCGAINCSNSKKKCPELSFHRFPEDPKRSKEWVVNTRRKDLDGRTAQYLSNNIRLCSLHFEQGMYYPGTRRLRKEAVPTVFNIPNPPPPVGIKRPLVQRQTSAPPAKRMAMSPEIPVDLIDIVPDSDGEDGGAGAGEEPLAEDCDEGEAAAYDANPHDGGAANKENVPGNVGAERRLNRLKSRVRRQRVRIQQLETELKAQKETAARDCMAGLSDGAKTIFKLQQRTAGMAPKGRRYTEEEMAHALALYFQGARAYRFLQKQFVLPSTRVLRKNMEKIQLQPGFHDAVLSVMKEKFRNASKAEKMCVVSFDEMSVRSKLTYLRGSDAVEGYEDHGHLGRREAVANHALVFMVRGLTGRWKQAVGFFLSAGVTKAIKLKELLLECIRRLQEAGMSVVATVCDMGTPNQQTYKLLGAGRSGSFQCGGETVTALHDVPHLFKCIRNALVGHNIEADGKVAKWSHLQQLFDADKTRALRVVPKLRDVHVRPTAFKKMTVRFATQVLSRSVAAGLSLYTDFGLLKEECRGTAAVVLKLNDLLDVLNSRGRFDPCLCKRAISRSRPATEEHHIQLLREADEWLGGWTVGDGADIDSVGGLRMTIRGVLAVWDVCKQNGCSVLCTRRLNQDGLENLFGVIRQRGGDRDHPNPTQFRHAYKHALLNSLMSAPPTANCEADGDRLMVTLRQMLPRPEPPSSENAALEDLSDERSSVMLDHVSDNCITYVAGYLVHKERKCPECASVLCKDSNVAEMASEALAALKSHTSLTDMDVGSLKLPTAECVAFVRVCYVTFQRCARGMTMGSAICQRLVSHVLRCDEAAALRRRLCHPRLLASMASRYMRLMLHPLCERLTREGTVKGPARKHKKLAKVSH